MDKINYRNHQIEIEYSYGGGIVLYIYKSKNYSNIRIPYILTPKTHKMIEGQGTNVYSNISDIQWDEVDDILDNMYL